MFCTKNIFKKLSFRDFGEPLGLSSGRRLSRAVKREILVYLNRYKISPGFYSELIEGVEMIGGVWKVMINNFSNKYNNIAIWQWN